MLQKAYNGNANFCALESENRIRVTTYELGAGLTLACGTGSCSSAAVCHS